MQVLIAKEISKGAGSLHGMASAGDVDNGEFLEEGQVRRPSLI
jgi:hypothetical protein